MFVGSGALAKAPLVGAGPGLRLSPPELAGACPGAGCPLPVEGRDLAGPRGLPGGGKLYFEIDELLMYLAGQHLMGFSRSLPLQYLALYWCSSEW